MRTRSTLPHAWLIDAINARDGATSPDVEGICKGDGRDVNTWRSVGQPVSHFETRIHLILRRSPSARGGVMGHVS